MMNDNEPIRVGDKVRALGVTYYVRDIDTEKDRALIETAKCLGRRWVKLPVIREGFWKVEG